MFIYVLCCVVSGLFGYIFVILLISWVLLVFVWCVTRFGCCVFSFDYGGSGGFWLCGGCLSLLVCCLIACVVDGALIMC